MMGIRNNTAAYIIDNLNNPQAATATTQLLNHDTPPLIIGSITPTTGQTALNTLANAATPTLGINPHALLTNHPNTHTLHIE